MVEVQIKFCAGRNCSNFGKLNKVSWPTQKNNNEFGFRVVLDKDTALYKIIIDKNSEKPLRIIEIIGHDFIGLDVIQNIPDADLICLRFNIKKTKLIPDILNILDKSITRIILEDGYYITRMGLTEIMSGTLNRRKGNPIYYNRTGEETLMILKRVNSNTQNVLALIRDYLNNRGMKIDEDYYFMAL